MTAVEQRAIWNALEAEDGEREIGQAWSLDGYVNKHLGDGQARQQAEWPALTGVRLARYEIAARRRAGSDFEQTVRLGFYAPHGWTPLAVYDAAHAALVARIARRREAGQGDAVFAALLDFAGAVVMQSCAS